MATVGYGEIIPLSRAGRIFTMGLIVTGVGATLYFLTVLAQLLVEGSLRDFVTRRSMQRKIEDLSGHIVVCGYGRFWRVVVDELARQKVTLVIIDVDSSKEAELARSGMAYLIGSALDDDVLERAGISRARALVAATDSDPDNVFITLSAREKNPKIA